MVFIMYHGCLEQGLGNPSILPAFYSLDRWPTIHQLLTKSMNEGRTHSYLCRRADVNKVVELKIYLIDSSDMPSIYSLAKNMVESFPRIIRLYFHFQHEIALQPEEMREFVSLFPPMHQLKLLWSWDDDANGKDLYSDGLSRLNNQELLMRSMDKCFFSMSKKVGNPTFRDFTKLQHGSETEESFFAKKNSMPFRY